MSEENREDVTALPPTAGYGVRRIANGFILTMPDETEVHCPTIEDVGKWFSDRITDAYDEARHYEWDGRFEVQFSHNILSP